MRIVNHKERAKRGCCDCLDYQKGQYKGQTHYLCKHDECPYHELDKYKKFNDYLKHEAPLSITKLLGLSKEKG